MYRLEWCALVRVTLGPGGLGPVTVITDTIGSVEKATFGDAAAACDHLLAQLDRFRMDVSGSTS